jgi:CubicO group peptidase (beta-lactamase class C family)
VSNPKPCHPWRWTQALPTEPGWYWLQGEDPGRAPEIVQVTHRGMHGTFVWSVGAEDNVHISLFEGCQWQGPITPTGRALIHKGDKV